ncbi:MAG: trypsin-like peptidase domain-containing protein [Chloroflexi bacterium]|nr:trypsin-like peptidase domain-containing protein [Chloroflexota bacterium]
MKEIVDRLKNTFTEKEESVKLLANLENLRASASIDDVKYRSYKSDYAQKISTANDEISRIKSDITSKLHTLKQQVNATKTELENLRSEYNSGNLSSNSYKQSENDLAVKLHATKQKIFFCQALLSASSLDTLGSINAQFTGSISSAKQIFRKTPIIIGALALIVVITLIVFFNRPANWNDTIKAVAPSVVYIETDNGTGSGFLLSSHGYLLTNYHVIDGAKTVSVTFINNKSYDAKIVKVEKDKEDPVKIGNSANMEPGNEVVALGYPLGIMGYPAITKGVVSRILTFNNGNEYIQTDTAFNHGNSGGALINILGEVVAIPTLASGSAEVQNFNLAITVNYARPFISEFLGR